MGRIACPCRNDREMQLFLGPRGSGFGTRFEDGADFEEPDVPLALGPVVLHTANQPREEPAAEVGLLFRKRILHAPRGGAVGGPERQRPSLQQAAAARDQLRANAAQDQLARSIGDCAGPVRAQFVGEGIVAAQPRDPAPPRMRSPPRVTPARQPGTWTASRSSLGAATKPTADSSRSVSLRGT